VASNCRVDSSTRSFIREDHKMLIRTIFLVALAVVGVSDAVDSVYADNQFHISFKVSEEQLQMMREDKSGILKVIAELQQPLTQDELKILESVSGMTLYDLSKSSNAGWGRTLGTGRDLSKPEMYKLAENLSKVGWVHFVVSPSWMENRVSSQPPPPPDRKGEEWLYPEFWQYRGQNLLGEEGRPSSNTEASALKP
jgi:hypothetical protein